MATKKQLAMASIQKRVIPDAVMRAIDALDQCSDPDIEDSIELVAWFKTTVLGIPKHVQDADRIAGFGSEYADIADRLRKRGYGPEVV